MNKQIINYKLEVLKNLRKKRSKEFWNEYQPGNSFVDRFVLKGNVPVYSLPSLANFSKEELLSFFVSQGQGVFHLLGETLYQFGIFFAISNWMSEVVKHLGLKTQTSSYLFQDSFSSSIAIEEIRNGDWSEETESVLFSTKIGEDLKPEDYFVNFVAPSIRLVRQKDNSFTVYTYKSEPVFFDIEVIKEGLTELHLSPNKKLLFRKTLRIELPPFKESVIENGEFLYIHTIRINKIFQFEDDIKFLEKSLTLKPMSLKSDASRLRINIEEDSGDGKIKYRFYENNTWKDWQEYDNLINYKTNSFVFEQTHARPFINNPNVGRLWISTTSLYSNNTFNFVPKDALVLRHCNSELSWKKGNYWEVNAWNESPKVINLGQQEIFINDVRTINSAVLPKGFCNIKVPARFIYITESRENDVFYPENIYHQISGGAGYQGVDLYFRGLSTLVSNAELLYGTNDKFKHSFLIENNELIVGVNTAPTEFYKESIVFITNRLLDTGNTAVQIRFEFEDSFVGSVKGYEVEFL